MNKNIRFCLPDFLIWPWFLIYILSPEVYCVHDQLDQAFEFEFKPKQLRIWIKVNNKNMETFHDNFKKIKLIRWIYSLFDIIKWEYALELHHILRSSLLETWLGTYHPTFLAPFIC